MAADACACEFLHSHGPAFRPENIDDNDPRFARQGIFIPYAGQETQGTGHQNVKATATRTLNPLPFQDLEPHRFEDLIRQLAYELRRWKTLEATGRSGSDEGVDIRGIELVPIDSPAEAEVDEEDPDASVGSAFDERLWIFQCKREKSLGPKRVREVVKESLPSLSAMPHGFVLAVACDVSKASRDAFREEMVKRGVAEFILWAKGELEDMLFQPKNDRLLFAYFGIALQPRRRNLSTVLRSTIAKKKQLASLLKDVEDFVHGKVVLFRDPTDSRYPNEPAENEPPARWLACRVLSLKKPEHLLVLWREHLAAVSADQKGWDYIASYNVAESFLRSELRSVQAWSIGDEDEAKEGGRRVGGHSFWNEYIPEAEQAYLRIRRAVPIERILALDTIGDGYYPVPHIFVEFDEIEGPFTPAKFVRLERLRDAWPFDVDPSPENRTKIFPDPLPKADVAPPPGFDDTAEKTSELSLAAAQRLGGILDKAKERRAPLPVDEGADDRRASIDQAAEAFRGWRDGVAHPVFAAVVAQLRHDGHHAGVRVRSAAGGVGRAFESIRLRVRMNRGGTAEDPYYASGHLEISCTSYGWAVSVSPEVEEATQQRYGAPRKEAPSLTAGTTSEELEGHVLSLLERLENRNF